MKSLIKSIIRRFKHQLEFIFSIEARIASKWASKAHQRLMYAQWEIMPQPEFFDHHIDLYYQWPITRNPLWLERGIFGSLALKGGTVLELSCGDGFNAKNFYSIRSKSIVACDFDPIAVNLAKQKNYAVNVDFQLADIRTAMPAGTFDNIIWDAAIEHFTPDEINKIMRDIKERLSKNGILSGYTVAEQHVGGKQNPHHEYEFQDMADLKRFFTPHFKNVKVFETIYSTRHNLYFWASDGTLPFDPSWEHLSN